jgi:CRP-like cAMP-binding protein
MAPSSFLRNVPVFEGVEEGRLLELEAAAETRGTGAHDVVYQRDERCDGLYLVRSGGVVLRNLVVGQPVERICDLGPGELFGESEALDGSRRQYQASAVRPSLLARLPPDPLWTFLRQQPLVEARLRTLAIYRRTLRLRSLLAPSTRRDPRIRMDREVQLRLAQGAVLTVRLEDLSHGGACLSAVPDAWRPGDMVRGAIEVPDHPGLLPLAGRVRWRIGGLAGLVFEPAGPPAPRDVDRAVQVLLARHPAA